MIKLFLAHNLSVNILVKQKNKAKQKSRKRSWIIVDFVRLEFCRLRFEMALLFNSDHCACSYESDF